MSKPELIQGVRGMNDVLPADEALWTRFEEAVASTMRAYGYQRIRTPIVEHTRLFDQAAAGNTNLLGTHLPINERRGVVANTRWME